ncbi:uncharacterized protein LOC143283531 [Babylonia areolata]|uniref:uncharacterized protein LOC143283531 n=1 Tax=Babylonia areolata TaxID=304850 RepID=UPI003FD1259B
MARSEYLTRSTGWRLLLLLLWTVLVCCILYVSKGRSVSVVSRQSLHIPPPDHSRLKRVAGNATVLQPQGDECRDFTASRQDLDIVQRLVHKRQGDGDASESLAVHCSVVSTCDRARPFLAHCFCSECRVYSIRTKEGHGKTAALSTEEFSRFIENTLQEKSFTTVEDVGWYMDIHCQNPAGSPVKITGDVLSAPRCRKRAERGQVNTSRQSQGTVTNKKINVLYFRFLSQWELPVLFPGLLSLVSTSATKRNVTVVQFDRYQATRWGDDETLSLLLQGDVGPFSYNGSLLDTLQTHGYCFRLEDLSCSSSRQQMALTANVTSQGGAGCGGGQSFSADRASAAAAIRDRLCSGDNLTDSETRTQLTSLLSDVHDVEGKNGDSRPFLSLSILNTRDVRRSQVLDSVLMNLFTTFLEEKREGEGEEEEEGGRTVVLMSDVGDPAFLRFDLSVRVQTQASNPALLLMSTAALSQGTHNTAQNLRHSSFSALQLHHFLKRLVQNAEAEEEEEEEDVSDSDDTDLLESYDTEGLLDSCGGLHVHPPFTCLCESQFVTYDNDTLMSGFAQFAVSLINAQLHHLHPEHPPTSRSRCATLSGLSFTNVRVGSHGNRQRILMDITLENDLFNDRTLRTVSLDVWDTDRIPQAEVRVFKADPLNPFPSPEKTQNDQAALRTLCQTGERLDLHHHNHPTTSSETGLLKRWSQERQLGRKGRTTHVHDSCLYLLVRDFGDSLSVEAANVCRDRRYDVVLHLSLMNMMSLTPLPLSASLGHVQRHVLAVVVKVSYTVPTFAYKLHPDFHVTYDQ